MAFLGFLLVAAVVVCSFLCLGRAGLGRAQLLSLQSLFQQLQHGTDGRSEARVFEEQTRCSSPFNILPVTLQDLDL